MNILRLNEGAPTHYFLERAGLPLHSLEPQWTELTQKGLVEIASDKLKTTEMGRRFLNRVLQALQALQAYAANNS